METEITLCGSSSSSSVKKLTSTGEVWISGSPGTPNWESLAFPHIQSLPSSVENHSHVEFSEIFLISNECNSKLYIPVIAAQEEPPQAMKTIFLSANASISVGIFWFRSEELPNWP